MTFEEWSKHKFGVKPLDALSDRVENRQTLTKQNIQIKGAFDEFLKLFNEYQEDIKPEIQKGPVLF